MSSSDEREVKIYQFPCSCGFPIKVKASTAGGRIVCEKCNQPKTAPSLRDLKRLAGLSVLSTADALREAIENQDSPFDGNCQVCASSPATVQWSVRVAYLIKRDPLGAPISLGLGLGSVNVKLGGTEEQWGQIIVPCQFCVGCRKQQLGNYYLARMIGSAQVALMRYPLLTTLTHRVFQAWLPPVIRHLRRLDLVRQLLDQECEYVATLEHARTLNAEPK